MRRYTHLSAVLYMLRKKQITLLNPLWWDDKDDSNFLEIYKKRKGLSSVLALCFARPDETYHHWKVFAPGPGGICIKFDKDALLSCLTRVSGVRSRACDYKLIDDLSKNGPSCDDLPFLKRKAFKDDKEFRIIFEDRTNDCPTKDFPILLTCISQIAISPWTPEALAK